MLSEECNQSHCWCWMVCCVGRYTQQWYMLTEDSMDQHIQYSPRKIVDFQQFCSKEIRIKGLCQWKVLLLVLSGLLCQLMYTKMIWCPWKRGALTRFVYMCTRDQPSSLFVVLQYSTLDYALRKIGTIHQVTAMLATSKNGLFPGHNHLLPPVVMIRYLLVLGQ